MQENHQMDLQDLLSLDMAVELKSQFQYYRCNHQTRSIFDQGTKQVRCQKIFQQKTQNKVKDLFKVFICIECSEEKNTIICEDCFDETLHEGHKVYRDTIVGGSCDCGIQRKFKKDSFCKRHKIQDISIEGEQMNKFTESLVNHFENIIFLYFKLEKSQLMNNRIDYIQKLQIYLKQLLTILNVHSNKPIMNRIIIKVFLHHISHNITAMQINMNKRIGEIIFDVIVSLFQKNSVISFQQQVKSFCTLLNNVIQNEEISDFLIIKYFQLYRSDPIFAKNHMNILGADLLSSSLSISSLIEDNSQNIIFFHIDQQKLKLRYRSKQLTIEQVKNCVKEYYSDWSYLLRMEKSIVQKYLEKFKSKILSFPCHLQIFDTYQDFDKINRLFYDQLQRKCIKVFIQMVSILMDNKDQRLQQRISSRKTLIQWIKQLKTKLSDISANGQNLFFTYERMWTICVYFLVSNDNHNCCFHQFTTKKSNHAKNIKDMLWLGAKQKQINDNYGILFRKLVNYLKRINPMFLRDYLQQQSQSDQDQPIYRQNFEVTYLDNNTFLCNIDMITFQIIYKMMDRNLFYQQLRQIIAWFLSNENGFEDESNLLFMIKIIQCSITELSDLVLASKISVISSKNCYQVKYLEYYSKIYNSIATENIGSFKHLKQAIEYIFILEDKSFQKFVEESEIVSKQRMFLIQSSSNQLFVNLYYQITQFHNRFHTNPKVKYFLKEVELSSLIFPKIDPQIFKIVYQNQLIKRIKQKSKQLFHNRRQFLTNNLRILQKFAQSNTNIEQLSYRQQRLQLQQSNIIHYQMNKLHHCEDIKRQIEINQNNLPENDINRSNELIIKPPICVICFTQRDNQSICYPLYYNFGKYPLRENISDVRKVCLFYSCNHFYHKSCLDQYTFQTLKCYQCDIEIKFQIKEIKLQNNSPNYKNILRNLQQPFNQIEQIDMSNATQDEDTVYEQKNIIFLIDSCLYYLMLLDKVRDPLILIKETYNTYKNIFRLLRLVSQSHNYQNYWERIFSIGQFYQNENISEMIPLLRDYLLIRQDNIRRNEQIQFSSYPRAFIWTLTHQIKEFPSIKLNKNRQNLDYRRYQRVKQIISKKDSFCACKKSKYDNYILMKIGWESKLQNIHEQIPFYCYKCLQGYIKFILYDTKLDRCLAFNINTGIFHIYVFQQDRVLQQGKIQMFTSQSAYLNPSLTPFLIQQEGMRQKRQTFGFHRWTFDKIQTDYLSYYYYISSDYQKQKTLF